MTEELRIGIPGQDIHQWLSSVITAGLMETGNNQLQIPKIPKVPCLLRQIQSNRECYDPSLVSIGPYHWGKEELMDMEELKVIFTSKFVIDSGICIEDFYCKVAEVANDARKCYEGSTFLMEDQTFSQMMLLDGCFILQFIFCLLRRPEDLKMPGHQVALVKRDLLLLENQLPFQVIWSLMVLRFGTEGLGEGKKLINDFIRHIRALPPRQDSCGEMIRKFLRSCFWRKSDQTTWIFEETEEHEPVHLLQLVHINHINKKACSRCSPRSSEWYSYRSAKDLRTVGIRFRPNWTNNYSDVELKSSVRGSKLILPPITIEESFKSMLLNLIAYETCCDSSGELWVTSYACFLDSLIQDVEDVKVLQSEGILNIFVREQEVADLFNQMSRNLVPNPYAYSDVKRRIEFDSKSIIKRWVAEWLHAYFSSPWSFIALIAATFTIVLTAIQSYVAVFPPQKNC